VLEILDVSRKKSIRHCGGSPFEVTQSLNLVLKDGLSINQLFDALEKKVLEILTISR
jgi:hypothetical protein